MDDHQVIARQAAKIERLEAENDALKAGIKRARSHIICIGGPLNDNRLGFSREQMMTFYLIKGALDDAEGCQG